MAAMSDGLLQQMSSERGVDSAQLQTPELAITIDSMEEIRESGPDSKPTSAGGWEAGMEVTQGVRLVTLIADGGMGSVWVATHTKLGTEVAVKLVAPALLEKQPTLVERLDREAAALGRLQNPNIVEIYEHGTTANGTPYIVMELLDGETLGDRLRRNKVIGPETLLHILAQTADALDEAHAADIVHRDVKPANIFLVSNGPDTLVKVLDFGMAKRTAVPNPSVVTEADLAVGTPDYMAPEQIRNARDVDRRVDVWAIGVVAYRALIGRLPFTGDNFAALCMSIVRGSFDNPTSLAPFLPRTVDAWFRRALAVEREDRFDSVGQAVAALSEALSLECDIAFKEVDIASLPIAPPPVIVGDGFEAPPSAPEPPRASAFDVAFAAVEAITALLLGAVLAVYDGF